MAARARGRSRSGCLAHRPLGSLGRRHPGRADRAAPRPTCAASWTGSVPPTSSRWRSTTSGEAPDETREARWIGGPAAAHPESARAASPCIRCMPAPRRSTSRTAPPTSTCRSRRARLSLKRCMASAPTSSSIPSRGASTSGRASTTPTRCSTVPSTSSHASPPRDTLTTNETEHLRDCHPLHRGLGPPSAAEAPSRAAGGAEAPIRCACRTTRCGTRTAARMPPEGCGRLLPAARAHLCQDLRRPGGVGRADRPARGPGRVPARAGLRQRRVRRQPRRRLRPLLRRPDAVPAVRRSRTSCASRCAPARTRAGTRAPGCTGPCCCTSTRPSTSSPDGVRVTTVRVEDDQAVVDVATTVANAGLTTRTVTVSPRDRGPARRGRRGRRDARHARAGRGGRRAPAPLPARARARGAGSHRRSHTARVGARRRPTTRRR